jgi:hypothetical protein
MIESNYFGPLPWKVAGRDFLTYAEAQAAEVGCRLAQQLDLEGNLHDLAPQNERLRLFDPAPAQLPGQTYMHTDHEESR